MRNILVPERAKFIGRADALEKREELARRYERRREGCKTRILDEVIKTAALGALVPQDLEQHWAMIRSRLPTYEQVRGEIQV